MAIAAHPRYSYRPTLQSCSARLGDILQFHFARFGAGMPFNAVAQEKILDFEVLGIPEVFDRDLRLAPIQKPERNNLAQVIVGTRRCGKTYRLFQEMRDIVRTDYDPATILCFNFEDERLKPYSTSLLSDVIDTFFAMRPKAREEGCFFFSTRSKRSRLGSISSSRDRLDQVPYTSRGHRQRCFHRSFPASSGGAFAAE